MLKFPDESVGPILCRRSHAGQGNDVRQNVSLSMPLSKLVCHNLTRTQVDKTDRLTEVVLKGETRVCLRF